MGRRDTSKYWFTVEVKNHLDNARRDENRRAEIRRKEGIVVFALFLLTYFLLIVFFGWTAFLDAFYVSLIVYSLALFWFTKEKIFLILGLLMILANVLYYADILGYI